MANQANLPAIRPRFLPSSPPRRSSRPLAISGCHPSHSQPTDHPTQSRRGTPVSPSVHVGAFLRFARPTRHGRRRHRLVRAALCSRCRTCLARQVRGRLCCRIGGWRWVRSATRRLHFFSSLAASSSTSLQAVTSSSSRTRTRRGATSSGGRLLLVVLLPRSRPWK